jgi:N-acetylneuraminate synthase/sialic acid synthase
MDLPLPPAIKKLFNMLPARVKVGTRPVGVGHPVFVIAEIGNNHNGDFELAKKTILAAKEAGAEAVKFQKRDVDAVFTKEMRDMSYDNPRSLAPTYGEHRKKLEFTREQFIALKEYAEELGLVFFVTPFDENSADFLEDIGVHAYKISSFDLTNLPLLVHVAKKGKPILLSTGMATLEEIDEAVHTILRHNDRLIVNHCTSIYPTPDENIDLNIVRVLHDRYKPLPVGYSGHEPDILPTVASVGLGASTVERHFTLDKTMRGSDHHMSIDPKDFKDMVEQIRRMETILGSMKKTIHDAEKPIREKHGKSIVAKRSIKKGERITEDMLTLKSPGTGLKSSYLQTVIGRVAPYLIEEETVLPKEALEWQR